MNYLIVYFILRYSRKGSLEKGLILNSGEEFILLRMVNCNRNWVSCFYAHNNSKDVVCVNKIFRWKRFL